MSQKQTKISDFFQDINRFHIIEKRDSSKLATLNEKPNEKYLLRYFHDPNYSFIKPFFQSIELRASLNHPSILPFTGFSYDGNRFVTIEPYLENGTLKKFIKDRQKGIDLLNFETIRSKIIIGLASGLAYLHQNGIIHKHLDSECILLDNEMHPKIIGTEKRIFENPAIDNDVKNPFSQFSYFSPEILVNERASCKSDVYTFSIILIELFKFEIPWNHFDRIKARIYEIITSILDGERPDISGNDIPEVWSNLIKQCWKKDPLERPCSIEIVQKLIDEKDKFFNDPKINQEELDKYIESVTHGLDFSKF